MMLSLSKLLKAILFNDISLFIQVKIDALNDSRLIGMCLYNVVVLSAVGLTLNLALEDKVALLYGINSGILLIGTTGTMLVVFVPKVSTINSKLL